MGKKDKVYLPQTQAGLVRYFDGYKEKIQITPEQVIYLTTAIIILEILLFKVY